MSDIDDLIPEIAAILDGMPKNDEAGLPYKFNAYEVLVRLCRVNESVKAEVVDGRGAGGFRYWGTLPSHLAVKLYWNPLLTKKAKWLDEKFTPSATRQRLEEIWEEGDPEIEPSASRAFQIV